MTEGAVTAYDVALRLIRQRDTTGHPDFVAAYLAEEASRVDHPLMLNPTEGEK